MTLAMTTAPDILTPYLVHFATKPNAIESVQIYEKCLNDIQTDFTERLAMLRNQLKDVSACVPLYTHSFLWHVFDSSAGLNKHNKITFCRFTMRWNA